MDNDFKLYGVIDRSTGKLVSDITNPKRKYWDRKANAEKAVKNYNPKYLTSSFKIRNSIHNKEDLQVVEILCKVEEAGTNG